MSMPDFDKDMDTPVGDLPSSFTWGAVAHACVKDETRKGDRIDNIAGEFEEVDFVIEVQTSLLTVTRPTAGDLITVDSVSVRVVNAHTCPSDKVLILFCKESTA